MNNPAFTDEQLTAYLDGELDDDTRTAIDDALASDDALGERLASLDIDTAAIKAGFDSLLTSAPQMPAMPEVSTPPETPASRWGALAAVFLVASVIGGLGTRFLLTPEAPQRGWVSYVAAYQALYTTDTLEHVQLNEPHATAELERVTQAVSRPLELAQLIDLPGLQYKRAQVLGFNGKPLAQLTFLTDAGEPIAICIIPSSGGNSAMESSVLEGMAATKWVDGGHAYLVIGGDDSDKIRTIAEALTARI